MKINFEYIYQRYINLVTVLFYLFIFGTLSFGRAFSLLHVNATQVPVFITEFFLLISFPVLLFRYRELFKLPRAICTVFIVFFLFGSVYLLLGISTRNSFVLRDFVLCGYLLFFPLVFFIMVNRGMLKIFIIILIASNLISLFVGRLLLFNSFPTYNFGFFVGQIKPTNLGLYYGISLSFLISFFPVVSKRRMKLLMILLIATNVYMLIFFLKRTLWFAFLALLGYLVFINHFSFVKILAKVIPIIVIASVLLFSFDSRGGVDKNNKKYLISKFKTMVIASACNSGCNKSTILNTLALVNSKETNASSPVKDKKTNASSPNKDKDICVSLAEKDIENLGNIIWRFEIWKQTIKFALKSPLFGRGFGIYPHYVVYGNLLAMPKKDVVNSGVIPAHNDLVTIFFKMGLVGLALYLFLNINVFLFAIRHIHNSKDDFIKHLLIALLGCFVFWHAMALFFDVIDSPPTSIFLWITMGMIFAVVEAG
jgi:hypothetical protein